MVCPSCQHVYAISNGIPNMVRSNRDMCFYGSMSSLLSFI